MRGIDNMVSVRAGTTPRQPPSKRQPQSRYKQIAEALGRQIRDGVYDCDARLPSESQLMQRFGASRVTVRLALKDLQQRRIILSRQGKGYFVARPKAIQDLGRLQGLAESVASVGFEVHSRVHSAAEVPATRRVAEALGLAPHETVLELTRVRYLNQKPMSLDVSYFPLDIGRQLVRHDLVNTDVFLLLERELGLTLGIADLQISVDGADDEIAERLAMWLGDPVLRIERLTSTVEGRPIDFEFLVGRGDAYEFRIRVPRW